MNRSLVLSLAFHLFPLSRHDATILPDINCWVLLQQCHDNPVTESILVHRRSNDSMPSKETRHRHNVQYQYIEISVLIWHDVVVLTHEQPSPSSWVDDSRAFLLIPSRCCMLR